MADPVTTAISITALAVSAGTAWFTVFRRGTVKMTRPSFVAFSYDVPKSQVLSDRPQPKAKIFLRALLYSTGKRGHVIENMFLVVRRGMEKQTFNVWGYGADEKLSRGSGLFVGETGLAANHHFNSLTSLSEPFFLPGDYTLDVFVALVGRKKPLNVTSIEVTVPEDARQDMANPDTAIWFDWEPDRNHYHGHVERR
jgi:hypothetical protein